MEIKTAIKYLNHPVQEIRYECAEILSNAIKSGRMPRVERLNECNNHVHSQYSFSPYSPSMIAWKAYQSGLSTCGIMDHESLAGCYEFRDACRLFGVVPTLGFEIRLNWNRTTLKGCRFNHPEQKSIGYFPVHGVPISKIPEIERFLAMIRFERKNRNRFMTERFDHILLDYGMTLNYESDVVPLSKSRFRGTETEGHIMYAAAKKILEHYKDGSSVIDFLTKKLGIFLSDSDNEHLKNVDDPYYLYDIASALKGFFSENVYIDANTRETPSVELCLSYLTEMGCIPTYTYLGNQKVHDRKGELFIKKYEDDILEEMLRLLKSFGMQALSYSPGRNNALQRQMIHKLCTKYELMEIVWSDVEHPREFFRTPSLSRDIKEYFSKTTWAIIGHEIAANENLSQGIFSKEIIRKYPGLHDRLDIYEKIGKNSLRR